MSYVNEKFTYLLDTITNNYVLVSDTFDNYTPKTYSPTIIIIFILIQVSVHLVI